MVVTKWIDVFYGIKTSNKNYVLLVWCEVMITLWGRVQCIPCARRVAAECINRYLLQPTPLDTWPYGKLTRRQVILEARPKEAWMYIPRAMHGTQGACSIHA